jgi:thiol-disulfide isomerase/thioredoxin
MLAVQLGPLALPVAPLLLLGSAWAAAALAARLGGAAAERALWWATGAGLLAARLAWVLLHGPAYAATPLAVLDLRDGGWHAPTGLGVGLLVLGLQAWRAGPPRRALAAAAALGLAAWGAGQLWQQHQAPRQLPDLALQPLGPGSATSLRAAVAGRPAVVNLWASWCGPCREEMPALAAAQQRDSGVTYLLVNQGEPAPAALAWLASQGLVLQGLWRDPGAALGPAVGSRGLPTTLFVDAQGRIVHAHMGVLSPAILQARVKALQP